MIAAYTNGSKKYSHVMSVGKDELVLYFDVDMKEDEVDAFAKLLNVKTEVEKFYACVVITENTAPKTFIAYRGKDDCIVELFNYATGIPAIEILRKSFIGGEIK